MIRRIQSSLEALAVKYALPPENFVNDFFSVFEKVVKAQKGEVIIEFDNELIDEKLKRKEYVPNYTSLFHIPDHDAKDLEDLTKTKPIQVDALLELHHQTEAVAHALVNTIMIGDERAKKFNIAAIITLGTTLESLLTEVTHIKCRKILGKNNYRKTAVALCKLGPLQRLEALIPFMTKGQFVLRESGNESISLIRSLIPLRNKFVHNSNEFIDLTISTTDEGLCNIKIPSQIQKKLKNLDIDNSLLEKYWFTYLELKETVLMVSDYEENDFIMKVNE